MRAFAILAAALVSITAHGQQLYFVHVDHLNTSRQIYDQNQTIVWRWDQQEPFGADTPNGDPGNTGTTFEFPLGISDYYRDRESGMLYAMQRDCYDPATGRYCQSDPIGLGGGTVATYVYVNSNPLYMVDRDGTFGVPGAIVGGVLGGGLYAVGQVLSGQQITTTGLLLSTAAGAASGLTGAYIFAGVARLGLSTAATVTLNAAGNAAAGAGLGAVFGAVSNLESGKCPGTDLGPQAARNALFGAAGGYAGARLALLAPRAGAAAQNALNNFGNVLFPRNPPLFTGSTGPGNAATAGVIAGAGIVLGEGLSNFPNISP